MVLKYDFEIENKNIVKELNRLINLIFKLLPTREENSSWEPLLKNIIGELRGMDKILLDNVDLFPLLCKLESLFTLTDEKDFLAFRRTIFECLSLLGGIKECLV